KVVLVNFWASWCGPCRFEMPEFKEIYEERLDADDFVILAVNLASSDARRDAMRFAENMELTFPIVFDTSGDVAARYGVRGLPASFFIDAEGVLRSRSYGPVL